MSVSVLDTDITKLVLKERQIEIRHLLERITHAATDEERLAAERRLDDLAAEWRGFPGQRRRGDLLHGVNVR